MKSKSNLLFDKHSNFNELWLQYLWKKNIFKNVELFTISGEKLRIIFPGWFNHCWGPDFKESRIEIGETSYFGDIEIHIDESAWHQHAHHLSEPYNKVILHVFLNKSQSQARNLFNQPVPSLCLTSDYLESFWKSFSLKNCFNKSELPGACGLSLNQYSIRRIKSIIQQAAESRMIAKSQSFVQPLRKKDIKEAENQLYTSICKSLGYSAFSEQLVKISQLIPYSQLKSYFNALHRQNRIEILSRWFGHLGLFEYQDNNSLHEDLRKEWVILQQKWEVVYGNQPSEILPVRNPFRPLNNPIRRLIGLYYHLQSVHFKGLISSWLRFFSQCQQEISLKKNRSAILRSLQKMFPQPSWDPFAYFPPPGKQVKDIQKIRFIGREKQLVILVNSIIPFFLAWSRVHGEEDLEKLLFRLMLILPGEGRNRKITFMENRLFKDNDLIKMKNSLGYYQGLIQIHDDCCTSFYEGCRNCTLLKWLNEEN